MAQVTITINSREYAIACDDGQEARIIKLARVLDEKAKQLTAGGGQINENMLLAMSGLLLADDLLEAQKNVSASGSSMPQPVEKVVEVEKIVEKIVEVEKPVEVEKIVERIVEVEKPVETLVEPDWSKLDSELSEYLKNVTKKIEVLASEIEML